MGNYLGNMSCTPPAGELNLENEERKRKRSGVEHEYANKQSNRSSMQSVPLNDNDPINKNADDLPNDVFTDEDEDEEDSEQKKMEALIENIKGTMKYCYSFSCRLAYRCQVCNYQDPPDTDYLDSKIRTYCPEHSYNIGVNLFSRVCHGSFSLCEKCMVNDKIKRIIDLAYILEGGIYINWSFEGVNKVSVKRSSGVVESDWEIATDKPLIILQRAYPDYSISLIHSVHSVHSIYCVKRNDDGTIQLSKVVELDEFIKRNSHINIKLERPSPEYLEEYKNISPILHDDIVQFYNSYNTLIYETYMKAIEDSKEKDETNEEVVPATTE